MAGEWLAIILAVGVPLTLRLIDYLLPKGHHFKLAARYSQPDHDTEEPDDETQ